MNDIVALFGFILEVDKIIAGPNVYICSECIKLCLDIIRENSQQKPIAWGHQKLPPPADQLP